MIVSIDTIQGARKRLAGHAVETPLLTNPFLNQRLGGDIFIKTESLQHGGAFKFRGAYNRLSQLSDSQRQAGVVAYSSGNHAQGVALAARLLGVSATIVMPADAPAIKLSRTRAYGADVRLYDRATESREDIAAAIADARGAVLVPAYDDPDIIAGQGTCGLELVRQLPRPPDICLVPCGGGGLLAGVATAVKALAPAARICAVEPQYFDDHCRSLRTGVRQRNAAGAASICDALLAPTPGELTWEVNRRCVDAGLSVSDAQVLHAMSYGFSYLKLVLEPGGAVTLAALLSGKVDVAGKTVVAIASGGNVDTELFERCLQTYPSP
ncbi:threonine/serine dehydratase [Exilibacterium tricleocarpae]|uniref:Threonine/serine dehydratase n=1 Tax=Exilibacterium tricleocarpae TaxID=2591008 RepID=A0A545U9E2_9GAMM|nr:threonine/serine dehydratase [Exilibacterium tricleocarpae]TQV86085.1 threonine/serine dehydratase [Exilibacterium tricleocarpae]